MPKRMLTEIEKTTLISNRYKDEVCHTKGLVVTVAVKDETHEYGAPQFVITRRKEPGIHADGEAGIKVT